jgi:hypothetical protein
MEYTEEEITARRSAKASHQVSDTAQIAANDRVLLTGKDAELLLRDLGLLDRLDIRMLKELPIHLLEVTSDLYDQGTGFHVTSFSTNTNVFAFSMFSRILDLSLFRIKS